MATQKPTTRGKAPGKAKPKAAAKPVAAKVPVKPNALGRKTKRTPDLEQRLFDAIREGCTRRAACTYVDITETTLYEWVNNFPEFSESLIRAENEAERGYTKVIQCAAQDGDWKAAAWWLERRRKDDYSIRKEVEHSGGMKIERAAEEMNDDELATIASTGS